MAGLDGIFRRRVYEAVRLVPYGCVTTYGFISTLAGMPRHARQVGWALHSLPPELVWGHDSDPRNRGRLTPQPIVDAEREAAGGKVPWHRVVNAKGQVSTHPDEAGTYRQIDLLRQEGLEVTDDGTIAGGLARYNWQPEPATVDQLELPLEVLYALDRQLDQ
jgi:methylated-DNA-protein-cysteine methyltransferase-like protein